MLKDQVIEAIRKLPDSASIDDMMYRIYVIDKIEQGKSALRENKTVTVADLKREISEW